MSNFDFTLERAHLLIDNAEQLSLALIMLHNPGLAPELLNTISLSLLEKLNSDLQDASLVISVNSYQGGMGEAPMRDALEPLSY